MKKGTLIAAILLGLAGFCFPALRAQEVALKSNLVADALLSPSIGVEVGLSPRWTVEAVGEMNAWSVRGHRWKHWALQPEVRRWLCDRFGGHFFGLHLHGGQYNVGSLDLPWSFLGTDFRKLDATRYQGWFAGAGVAYGYAWILSRHWNLEAELGLGFSYTDYDRFRCAGCGEKIERDQSHTYVGPTRAALSLVYLF